ncbi:unnamed protein product [Rhizoctonia solani]|uniref:Exosome complex protein n=1 Tax=Rhizoctonia solani TaxID=456999 RepID=A0A8H2XC56_9AGAM|nr:unnamed protein product [Rhizoctonia solani]
MTDHLSETVDDLVSSIDDLEEVLAPLLAIPLPELNKQLSSPLDRAKLQVWLSYVLNDLVWIQLRANGHNPNNLGAGETHDVVGELDRVKSYFAKIKEAENPAKRALAVDGKVANRFIKHALASAISQENFAKPTHTRFDEGGNAVSEPSASGPSKDEPEPDESDESSGSSSDDEPAPGTWKAKKRAREADLAASKADRETSDEEDEPMAGWEEPEIAPSTIASTDNAGPSAELTGKPKRARIDPFAGYDGANPKPSKLEPVVTSPEPEPSAELLAPEDAPTSGSPSPSVGSTASASTSTSAQKKTRRTRRGGRRVDQRRENKRENLAREALERSAAKK